MKDPTRCTTSCRRDAPRDGSRLPTGTWQLLLLILLFLLVCSPSPVRVHAPLLGLQEAVAHAPAHRLSVYLLGLCTLWCGSLQLGSGLTLTLSRKLCVEVLLPVQQAVWQPLTIAWARGLQLLTTLVHGARRGIQRLLQREAGLDLLLLPVAQWACCSLVSPRQENGKALEQMLRAVLQQVAVSLLVCCLDKLQGPLGRGAQAMRCSGLLPLERARLCWAASEDLDAVTSILPALTVPFSRRFPGPDPATLSRLPAASIRLCLVAGSKDAGKGGGGCRVGTTKLPVSSRFQSNGTSKMAVGASPKQALAWQAKVTCVLTILLYVCAASLLVQILK